MRMRHIEDKFIIVIVSEGGGRERNGIRISYPGTSSVALDLKNNNKRNIVNFLRLKKSWANGPHFLIYYYRHSQNYWENHSVIICSISTSRPLAKSNPVLT